MEILSRPAHSNLFESLGMSLPSESTVDEMRETWRQAGIQSLYFFTTAVLGWSKVRQVPHLELCNFIQDTTKGTRKVLLVPRDTYKSTIGSKSFPLWILIQPMFCGLPGLEHRILLWSHASENAKKQIRSIKQQVEKNEKLKWLYPEIVPNVTTTTWSDSNLLFPREGSYGEDTLEAAGLDTHLVSRHYTIQIKDDMEDKASYEQPTVRQKVKDTYVTAEALFVDEQTAFDLLIGTRWGTDDLYDQIQREESDSYHFMVRPLHWTREDLELDLKTAREEGTPPIWNMDPDKYAPIPEQTYFFFPELFPAASCKRIKQKQGSFFYSMLYLNNPKDASLSEFKDSDLCEWIFDDQGNIILFHRDETREIIPVDSCKRVLFWDPAMSEADKKRNSRNAMVVMYQTKDGKLLLAEAWAEHKDPTLLFSRFIGFHQRHQIHVAAIEDAGFQRTLKFPLFYEMRKLHHEFSVKEQPPIGAKDTRIRGLLPFVENHQVFVRRGLKEFREELKGFPLFKYKDIIDAAAACLELFGITPQRELLVKPRLAYSSTDNRLATRSVLTGY